MIVVIKNYDDMGALWALLSAYGIDCCIYDNLDDTKVEQYIRRGCKNE